MLVLVLRTVVLLYLAGFAPCVCVVEDDARTAARWQPHEEKRQRQGDDTHTTHPSEATTGPAQRHHITSHHTDMGDTHRIRTTSATRDRSGVER